MAFEEKVLRCKDCGADFTFTVGEQEFYAEKGFENEPVRCKDCRSSRKRERNSGNSFGERAPRTMYDVVCANCGEQTQVPFLPKEDRPVYCRDCFQQMR